jgi:23S rRNA pseudouridine2605 synthase
MTANSSLSCYTHRRPAYAGLSLFSATFAGLFITVVKQQIFNMTAKKTSRSGRAKDASGKPKGASGKPKGASGKAKGKGASAAHGPLGKRKTDNFNKFYNKKRNSAIKEGFRQEKKAVKRERKEAIERHFEERRASRSQQSPGASNGPAGRPGGSGRPAQFPDRYPQAAGPHKKIVIVKGGNPAAPGKPAFIAPAKPAPTPKGTPGKAPIPVPSAHGDQLPLNKYIAHGGICSRRDAAELIRQGKVTVNGQLVTEPGTKVAPTDLVKVAGKKITISRNFVYVLLNKPKDYITTTDDPQGRRTVLDLIRQATPERVYPVGRLDRNTSGVLLLTNDGDLAQKLAHPSHQIKKIYHVVLDKPLTRADFDKIINGEVQLEDGPALVDVMAYTDPKDKTQIGLEIHSGRNRIVRRIFEHLGYDVQGLDRVMYAGLTKKNVQRGHWRLLTEKEVRVLKYLNSSIKGSTGRAKEMAAAAGLDPEGLLEDTRPVAPKRPPTASAAPHKGPRPASADKRPHSSAPRPATASPRPAAKRQPARGKATNRSNKKEK